MFPREFKNWDIQNWVQIISPCTQWLVRCHATIQRCSAAPSPKLSGTEKLLPCHRLSLGRSFFPDWYLCILLLFKGKLYLNLVVDQNTNKLKKCIEPWSTKAEQNLLVSRCSRDWSCLDVSHNAARREDWCFCLRESSKTHKMDTIFTLNHIRKKWPLQLVINYFNSHLTSITAEQKESTFVIHLNQDPAYIGGIKYWYNQNTG